MAELEGQIWAVQDNDNINFVYITKQSKNKIQALNEKGRELSLSEDKFLWLHPTRLSNSDHWQDTLIYIQTAVDRLRSVIDILLLWETALELEVSEISDLADLYFGGEITTEHLVALWRALAEERTHFKRRGKLWEARTLVQVQELKIQRERQQERAKELAIANDWLRNAIHSVQPILTEEVTPFVDRLNAWLGGESDKQVEEVLSAFADKERVNPRELAFEVLQKIAKIPLDADRDLIVAGLKPEFPTAINEAVQTLQAWLPAADQPMRELLFSIDDEETREVDDALGIEREDNLWKVIIAIADPSCLVHRGDIFDREAMRRGTTVYMPTQTILMLPEPISCNLASLGVQQVRSSIILSVWFDEQGQVVRSHIGKEAIQVKQRLSYVEADMLLSTGQDETAQKLRELMEIATQLRTQRSSQGAFTLQRPEYKVSIKENTVDVTLIDYNSPSRILVGEMMILANYIAANYAQNHQVPIIYRTQEAPLEPVTPELLAEPLGSLKALKLMRPSALSLEPSAHSGLGLTVYTQLTSPLRRFADLVMQRQLAAHLIGEPLPYDQEELFKVLATAERTAREARIFEGDAKRRWFIRYLQETWRDTPLEVLIIDKVKTGYKVEMQPWGVEAFLGENRNLQAGERLTTVVDKVKLKTAAIRLKLV